MDYPGSGGTREMYEKDSLRLEGVTTSVGFDDLLDYTLTLNHGHFDHFICVTSHDDKASQKVAIKHGATMVVTDGFTKNGRRLNKGAAINSGFGYWQYRGWRLHLDADIVLPDKFRQTLFNHTELSQDCIYGADRIDVVGKEDIKAVPDKMRNYPQHRGAYLMDATLGGNLNGRLGGRLVRTLDGYLPIGYFQLWHASTQKAYPYSLGSAAGDDVLYAGLYPRECRRLLPSIVCLHLTPIRSWTGCNWDGVRRQPRLDV